MQAYSGQLSIIARIMCFNLAIIPDGLGNFSCVSQRVARALQSMPVKVCQAMQSLATFLGQASPVVPAWVYHLPMEAPSNFDLGSHGMSNYNWKNPAPQDPWALG